MKVLSGWYMMKMMEHEVILLLMRFHRFQEVGEYI